MRRLALLLASLALASCDDGRAPTACERTGFCVDVSQPGTPVTRAPALDVPATYVSPVPNPLQISSTFGPRWKASASRYDFHPGIDYYDVLGTPVYAIGAGVVRGAYPEGSAQYPNGGNVVVVEHTLAAPTTFHGVSVTRFYAVYLHLQSFSVAVDDAVTAGQTIGAMGMTGDTDFVHLHFETRVQTVCSLPYQLANPTSSCAAGFDPHVHPYHFVGGENDDAIVLEEVADASDFVVRYTATRGDLDLDVIETDFGTLDFDARTGIDASSLAHLDDFHYGWVTLVPQPFLSSSDTLVVDLHFPRRPSYLEVRDIHGVGVRY